MQNSQEMPSNSTEILFELFPFIKVFKDGHVHRFLETDFVPPSEDPQNKVQSKDIIISQETNASVRLYLPNNINYDNKKLPLLIYIHGGAFCIASAFSSVYHSFLNKLVDEANVIAVSVEYRLAPEHPIPACYDDSWSAFKWVVSNGDNNSGSDSEPWLRDYADFSRIFLAGDSAGANIAHDMMVRASDEASGFVETEVKLVGMALIHPFCGDDQPDLLWNFLCKDENSRLDDPRFNPAVRSILLEKLVCKKILICIAEKDFLRQRGWSYYEAIKNSGWGGEVELEETEAEDHVFHLENPGSPKADIFIKKMATFFK
ncbi:deacetylase [Lithospermum erythrorhizon]|uniref:Deacetylase n=1 Tax=Lithospermum erythrorhizon TaxID=34254 RepID=A0AAV3RZL2_LITER